MIFNTIKYILLISVCYFTSLSNGVAQVLNIVDDTYCIFLDNFTGEDVTINDEFGTTDAIPYLITPSNCFRLINGILELGAEPESCCGKTIDLEYSYEGTDSIGVITVTLKCPKPDCSFTDLDDLLETVVAGNDIPCLNTCELNTATYLVSYNPSYTYTWVVTGGVFMTTINPATIDVDWGVLGTGNIHLDIFDGVVTNSYDFCIDILDSPIADFMPLNSCACLNSPIAFLNSSIGAGSYYWDFGDGNFSNAYEPTHTYDAAGVYDVVLYVNANATDLQGNILCCCSDSTVVQIEIDPRPGPDIYWISTLCPGDSTKYWTDVEGCTYTWTVEDSDGNLLLFDGQGTDTICVSWIDGPYGVVTLELSDCPAYCDKPVSALVPIVSTVEDIIGETVVCQNTTYTYDLPKWQSVIYDWTVTGGYVVTGNGMHSVTIHWYGPGAGTIHVDYYSDFLGGLPGHDGDDCSGYADLSVNIKPEYTLTPPLSSTYCVGDTAVYTITDMADLYAWDIDPSATVNLLGSTASVIWPSVGFYTITVYPLGLNPFCNDTSYHYVNVVDVVVPDSISGPTDICPEGLDIYYAHTSLEGMGFAWNVTGGSPALDTGAFVEVTWDAVGPYEICLSQFDLSDPGCKSDTICRTFYPKSIIGPLVFIVPETCVDDIRSYTLTPTQHPDANYWWSISDPLKGSIITDPNSSMIDVQWNNIAGTTNLTAYVILCGDTVSVSNIITINPRPNPVITQSDDLCPGSLIDLDAGVLTGDFEWSTGELFNPITIDAPGTYLVTVTNGFGCEAIATYEVFSSVGPEAGISSPSGNELCTGSGSSIVMHTLDNDNYTYDWYCNDVLQAGPGMSTLVHMDHDLVGVWKYYVIVTDTSTNCIIQSANYYIHEIDCDGGGTGGCNAQAYSFSLSNMNQSPYCNNVDFTVSGFNYTITSWNFDDGDPSYTGPISSPTHIYNEAKYYLVTVTGTVPSSDTPPGADCEVHDTTSVCIPLAAYFECSVSCDKLTVEDKTSYLEGHNIASWLWSFGDGNTSINPDEMHIYDDPGTYTVTLTVTDVTGCMADYSKVISIGPDPNPTILAMPEMVCFGDAIDFSISGGGSIISYDWDFGDSSGNGGASPSHSYVSSGTYSVILTITNSNGCIGADTIEVLVYPEQLMDTIIFTPDLIVCNGVSVELTAPAGVSHTWNNGETGNVFTTDTSGIFNVEVFDANGCSYITPSVEVIVLPPVDATITGDTVICDNGCVTLSAPLGFGYMYQWKDEFGTDIPSATNSTFDVCDYSYHPTVSVIITDENGCTGSDEINIYMETSPIVGISVVGPLCAGEPNILTVDPVLPDVVYSWSNGDNSLSITVYLAGTYNLIARDTLTGCTGSASVTVNPLPDFCIMPSGCYEVCNPDTLCGPPDMLSYQWNMDGEPIDGETDMCLEVTTSGSYSLTAVNIYNCVNTSDTLILVVIPCCDDEDTEVTATEYISPVGGCCFELSYNNSFSNAAGMKLHTSDGEILYSGVDPGFMVFGSGINFVTLIPASPATTLPTGTVSDFIDVCMTNTTSSPALVLIDWLDADSEVICQDSVWLDCPTEPDCIYLASDSIWCENDQVNYEMTICNPASNLYNIGYIVLNPSSPVGVVLTPDFFDITIDPLLPGECRDFNVIVSGSANELLCYNLIGHEFDPFTIDTSLCCTLDTTYCVLIPGCTPCDSVFVESVVPNSEDSCCYVVTLNNYYNDDVIDGIDICVLTDDSEIGLDVVIGGVWNTTDITPTMISIDYNVSSYLPFGTIDLPEICITKSIYHTTLVEVKWMSGDNIVCKDTIALDCENDCGYLTDVSVLCDSDGSWVFQGYITNTSTTVMNTAFISFNDVGMDIYNTTILMGSLLPGDTYGPFSINIGAPASDGDILDVSIVLHALGHNYNHTECCEFPYQLELPDCQTEPGCICDEYFKEQVYLGAEIITINSAYSAEIAPIGDLEDCDKVIWDWIYQSPPTGNMTTGNESVFHTFPGPGEYKYCMTVIRTQADGKQCEVKYTGEFEVEAVGVQAPGIYPNPTPGNLTLKLEGAIVTDVMVDVYNYTGMKMVSKQLSSDELKDENDLIFKDLESGIYYIRINYNGKTWIKKFIVMK